MAKQTKAARTVKAPGGGSVEEFLDRLEHPRKKEILAFREHVLGDEWQVAGWTFAGHHENDVQERDRIVDRAVAGLYAAKARAEALEHNRAGRYAEARRVLENTERRIRQYAGNDPELNHIARNAGLPLVTRDRDISKQSQ